MVFPYECDRDRQDRQQEGGMRMLRRTWARFLATFSPSSEDGIVDELESHLEALADEEIRRGVDPGEARRRARLRLGGIEPTKESWRDQRRLPIADALARDLRFACRTLRKTPAFTLGAIATVALSVGATTAIFSVVYGVLVRQLPYRDAQRLFWIWVDVPGRGRTGFNVPDFIDYRDASRMLSGFAGYFAYGANLSDEPASERVQGIRATGNLFDVLGAGASRGRVLQPGDERPGSEHVAVLTDAFWRRRFGADESVVGRAIRLNAEDYTIVGVLASGFALPVRDVDFVLPFSPERDPRRALRNSVNFVVGVGRLASGASASQAAGELNAISAQLRQRFPVENARKRGVQMLSVLDGIVGPIRTALVTVFAGVGAVLLIACANIANLMLTRATARRRDLAVQLALGSSRINIVRQVLVESVLVSVVGGVIGMLLARSGVAGLVALAPADLPRAGEIRVDVAVMLFSLAVAALTGVLFGVIPALTSARVDVRDALQAGGRGTSAGGDRVRGLLVSGEVAVAVVLLVAMTMLAKSFANVQAVSPGFDADGVLSARITLPPRRFAGRDAIVAFQQQLALRVSSLPGVTQSGAITLLPLSGLISRAPFTVEARPVERERSPFAQYRTVTTGYFEAARIPLKRGRTFSDLDTAETRAVAVVSEELAHRWLDGLEPIGARLLLNDTDQGGPRSVEIIGVVGNVQQNALDEGLTADLYLTYSQLIPEQVAAAAGNMFWIVRTARDPMSLAPSLASEVRRIDPDVVASQIRPLNRYLSDALAQRRFSVSLMAAFALAALALAITGIYAVVMYSVSQRGREIGIRLVLGATRTNIVRLVVGRGLLFVIIGLAVGTTVALAATRLMSTMLFGLTATDVATFSEVAILVAALSVVACALPTIWTGRSLVSVLQAE
jgi:putative ABC transport system permease protein